MLDTATAQVNAGRADVEAARAAAVVADDLEVLDAQRVLFVSETDLMGSREDELTASVQLYRALGGGWSDEELRRVIEQSSVASHNQ